MMLPALPPWIRPDVGGRLVVDATEPQIGDSAGRRDDRGAPFLRIHARMGGAPVEAHLERLGVRRAQDDVSDRRSLVVDIPDRCVEPLLVERRSAQQPDLLLRGEQQLDAGMRPVLRQHASSALQHRSDGRLVVGAEDRPAGVPDDALVDHRLQPALRRNRVEVRAEEDRRAAAVPARLDAAVQVPHVRADRRAGVVFLDGQAEVAQVARDRVGNRALLTGRARRSRRAR